MLFYLTNTLIIEKSYPIYNDICKAIFNLAVQCANGNHKLIGDIDVITSFKDIFASNFLVGQLFNKIYQNIAFEVVPSFVNYYVEVVVKSPYVRIEGNKTIAQVEYNRLILLDTTNKTSLVCEFLYDAEFYSFVLKWYIKQLSINVHFAFNQIDGGGTNTYKNIDKELTSNHITLSILDTDCRYPGDTVKKESTYGKCIGIGKGNVLFKLIPLNVHELENLVPLNYVDLKFSSWTKGDVEYARKKRAFDFLRKDADNILPYFDFKKGIKYNDDYRTTPGLQSFAKRCYSQNDEWNKIQPNFNQFVTSLHDKDYIYTELIKGTGTIKMVLELIAEGNVPEPNLCDFQKKTWDIIGQEMLNWCIASNPSNIL